MGPRTENNMPLKESASAYCLAPLFEVCMHLKRWLTGIIIAPILIFPLFIEPRWPFHIVLALISLAGLLELFRLHEHRAPLIIQGITYIVSSLLFLTILLGRIHYWPLVVVGWTFLPMIAGLFLYSKPEALVTSVLAKSVFGPCYISLPLGMLALIDRYPRGNLWVLFLFVVVFAGDTGAFYLGRLLGKHKLSQTISPGKTWEGAIGGGLSTLFAGLWFFHLTRLDSVRVATVLLLLGVTVAAQLGDLAESMLKRSHGKKDSGSVLPGHGGVLDRIDGLLFAIPILYVYLIL